MVTFTPFAGMAMGFFPMRDIVRSYQTVQSSSPPTR